MLDDDVIVYLTDVGRVLQELMKDDGLTVAQIAERRGWKWSYTWQQIRQGQRTGLFEVHGHPRRGGTVHLTPKVRAALA